MSDYTIFRIPKRSGGYRTIEAPNDELKAKQRESYEKYRFKLRISPYAHGFASKRSIVTMAQFHCNKKYVMAVDFKDFFPSVTKDNFIKEMTNFVNNGTLSEELFNEFMKDIDIHFYDFNDGKGSRLPQGAPASPFLSNVFLYQFDHSMAWSCYHKGVTYTRYADDFVVSGDIKNLVKATYKIGKVRSSSLDLTINTKKTKLMPFYRRQYVCGLVVNGPSQEDGEVLGPRPPKTWRKNLRAALHQQGFKKRPEAWESKDLKKLNLNTKGRLAFECMVHKPHEGHLSNLDLCSASRALSHL